MSIIKRSDNSGYLNFFEIELSGLYKIQRKTSKNNIVSKCFGLTTKTVFKAMADWMKGRQFRDTCPWALEGKAVEDPVMCYCKEIKELENGDFILVLWKHDPSDVKGFRGLELDKNGNPTGKYLSGAADKTSDNYIWGHPCYYWIIPEYDIVVSLKFEDSKCDTDLMQKWVTQMVRHRIRFPDYNSRKSGDAETRIMFSTPSAPEAYNVIYKFKVKLKEFKTNAATLEKLCETTTSVLLKNEVYVSDTAASAEAASILDRKNGLDKANVEIFDLFQTFLSKFFAKEDDDDSDNVRKVEILIEASPSIEQMKELMEYSSSFPDNGFPDVVFIDGIGNKTSIKKHRLVERVVLPQGVGAYSCESLYNVIKEQRASYIHSIRPGMIQHEEPAPKPAEG